MQRRAMLALIAVVVAAVVAAATYYVLTLSTHRGASSGSAVYEWSGSVTVKLTVGNRTAICRAHPHGNITARLLEEGRLILTTFHAENTTITCRSGNESRSTTTPYAPTALLALTTPATRVPLGRVRVVVVAGVAAVADRLLRMGNYSVPVPRDPKLIVISGNYAPARPLMSVLAASRLLMQTLALALQVHGLGNATVNATGRVLNATEVLYLPSSHPNPLSEEASIKVYAPLGPLAYKAAGSYKLTCTYTSSWASECTVAVKLTEAVLRSANTTQSIGEYTYQATLTVTRKA